MLSLTAMLPRRVTIEQWVDEVLFKIIDTIYSITKSVKRK
jgi:hypothetical protein